MAICQDYIYPVFLSIVIELIYNCKQQKNALKYLYLCLLINNDKLLSINKLLEFVLSCASIYNFWSIFFAAVETSDTLLGKLG